MPLNKDLREFIEWLNSNEVEYVIVGAMARISALFRGCRLSADDLTAPDKVIQLGHEPNRIDILTSISGVSFEEAVADAKEGQLGTARVRFIGREAMRRNKLAAGRPKDLVDAALLAGVDGAGSGLER